MALLQAALKRALDAVSPAIEAVAARLVPHAYKNLELAGALNRQNQMLLKWHYAAIREGKIPAPAFEEVEFRCYSQNGEDGILLYLFSLAGVTCERAVEICAGNGIECNSANLVVNHGWNALMIDGDRTNVRQGQAFYRRCRDTFQWPPRLLHAWVTADNVNRIITENGFAGEVDLLCLDLDGVDYWIWKAITTIEPRVVMVEYNPLWGPDQCVTVPYRPDFNARNNPHGADYFGASLAAFVKLANERGYRLVGCQRYGFNAFFVRAGVAEHLLPAIPVTHCLTHPRVQFAASERLPRVRDREWVRP